MASEFGVNAIPEVYKTPDVMHVLYTERSRINAIHELKKRASESPITKERVFALIKEVTRSIEQASRAEAKFVLEETRPNK